MLSKKKVSNKFVKQNLETILLQINGADEAQTFNEYKDKLNNLYAGFRLNFMQGSNEVQLAKSLHDYLWHDKPWRFTSKQHNLLIGIDRQLGEGRSVGNCQVMTQLYSILGNRLGLDLYVLVSESHIMSILRSGKKWNRHYTNIENTKADGFGLVFNYHNRGYARFDLNGLVASSHVNHSLFERYDKGDLDNAIKESLQAIEYADLDVAYSNFFLLLKKVPDKSKVLEYLDKGLKLNPYLPQFYYERGLLKYNEKCYKEAVKDFKKTLFLARYLDYKQDFKKFRLSFGKNPLNIEGSFIEAYKYSGLANLKLKRHRQALKNFNDAAKINLSLDTLPEKTISLLLNSKKYKLAISLYDKLLEKREDPSFYYAIAVLNDLLGKKDTAKEYLDIADNLPLSNPLFNI